MIRNIHDEEPGEGGGGGGGVGGHTTPNLGNNFWDKKIPLWMVVLLEGITILLFVIF